MDNLTFIAVISICISAISVVVAGVLCTICEASIAREALRSMTQQPDESSTISKTLFVSMSMCESASIYALLIAMILIFSNPFWNQLSATLLK